MRKTIFITFFGLCFFVCKVSAQTPATTETAPAFSIADSSGFIGKYKYEGLPFEYMEVTVKDSKLFYAGGEYSGALDVIKDKKDTFDAGGVAVFSFIRSEAGKITELQIEYQGQTFAGTKEGSK